MKKLMLLCLSGLIAAAASSVATADERDPGYYASLGTGYVSVEKPSFADSAVPGSGAFSSRGKVDFTGSVGYLYASGLRTEIEISFRRNDVDGNSVNLAVMGLPNDASGDLRALGGMVNLLYDFDTNSNVLPYLGGGMGLADVAFEIYRTGMGGGDTVVAFQGLAGVELALSEDLAVRCGYRFFVTSNADMSMMGNDYRTHNLEIGVSYRF